MELLWLAVSTIAIGVFGCVAWFWKKDGIKKRKNVNKGKITQLKTSNVGFGFNTKAV